MSIIEPHVIYLTDVWMVATYIALMIIASFYHKFSTVFKELWRILLTLLSIYIGGYAAASIYYLIVLFWFSTTPEKLSFLGKSIPSLIGVLMHVLILLLLNYLSCLIKARGNETLALRYILGQDKISFMITLLSLFTAIYVVSGPAAYYLRINDSYIVYYSDAVLAILWFDIVLAIYPLYVIFQHAKPYLRVKGLIDSLKIIGLLLYFQFFIGILAVTLTSLLKRSFYAYMNFLWLFLSIIAVFVFVSSLTAPFIRYMKIFKKAHIGIDEETKVPPRKILIEYDPKVNYSKYVISDIVMKYSKLPIIIVGSLEKPLMSSKINYEVTRIPLAVSGFIAQTEGISITDLSLISHTILNILSNIRREALLIIDDITDIIIANDEKRTYLFLKQLLEHGRNFGCIALLNMGAVKESAKALFEGLFETIYVVNSEGIHKIK